MRAWPDVFKLLPVCWAIIVVLDELGPEPEYDPDGFILLDDVLRSQSFLMIRTGEESGLSAPISFQSVREQALPLARPDRGSNNCVDAVRVTLATAVRFVADLQRREEAAIPESAPASIEQDLNPPFPRAKIGPGNIPNVEEWVDQCMQMADENGIKSIQPTRQALLNVRAAQRGEHTPDRMMPYYWSCRWR